MQEKLPQKCTEPIIAKNVDIATYILFYYPVCNDTNNLDFCTMGYSSHMEL